MSVPSVPETPPSTAPPREPGVILATILQDGGRQAPRDYRQLEGLLRDRLPERPREVFALLCAARAGVPAELLSPPPLPPAALRDRLVRQILDRFWLPEVAARWAVSTWEEAVWALQGQPPATPWLRRWRLRCTSLALRLRHLALAYFLPIGACGLAGAVGLSVGGTLLWVVLGLLWLGAAGLLSVECWLIDRPDVWATTVEHWQDQWAPGIVPCAASLFRLGWSWFGFAGFVLASHDLLRAAWVVCRSAARCMAGALVLALGVGWAWAWAWELRYVIGWLGVAAVVEAAGRRRPESFLAFPKDGKAARLLGWVAHGAARRLPGLRNRLIVLHGWCKTQGLSALTPSRLLRLDRRRESRHAPREAPAR